MARARAEAAANAAADRTVRFSCFACGVANRLRAKANCPASVARLTIESAVGMATVFVELSLGAMPSLGVRPR